MGEGGLSKCEEIPYNDYRFQLWVLLSDFTYPTPDKAS